MVVQKSVQSLLVMVQLLVRQISLQSLCQLCCGLDVDTAFQVNGVTDTDYNGSFVVNEVLTRTDDGVTSFKYLNSIIPGSDYQQS